MTGEREYGQRVGPSVGANHEENVHRGAEMLILKKRKLRRYWSKTALGNKS